MPTPTASPFPTRICLRRLAFGQRLVFSSLLPDPIARLFSNFLLQFCTRLECLYGVFCLLSLYFLLPIESSKEWGFGGRKHCVVLLLLIGLCALAVLFISGVSWAHAWETGRL